MSAVLYMWVTAVVNHNTQRTSRKHAASSATSVTAWSCDWCTNRCRYSDASCI